MSAAHASATPSSTIALLQSQSLTTLVQQEIERMILDGELCSGDKLNEAALAARLRVSRGPVREAFRALQESGLVQTEKNRGVFVREMPMQEADETYTVRAALDQLVGQILAVSIAPAQMKELRQMQERMERAVTGRSLDDYYPLNLQFHDLLVQFTGNGKLLSTYRRLVNELSLYRRDTLAQGSKVGGLTVSNSEHRRIVQAIASGDAEAAGRSMHEHVMASRARMRKAKGIAATAPPDQAKARDSAKGQDPVKRQDPVKGQDPLKGHDPIKGQDPIKGHDKRRLAMREGVTQR